MALPSLGAWRRRRRIWNTFERDQLDLRIAAGAQDFEDVHQFAIGHGAVGAQEDVTFLAAVGHRVERAHQIDPLDQVFADRNREIRLDADIGRLVRLLLRGCGRGRQIDRQVHGRQRRSDHEDDQEDQNDVDERRDIDLVQFRKIAVVIEVGVCDRCAHRLLRCRRSGMLAAADMGTIEIARQQPSRGARGTADQFHVALGDASEVVVDDDGGNGCDQTDGGGKQRLGDAGGHHREVRGLRLRNPDEAVHDAPDRAEQSDERGRRADGRQQTHPEPDPPRLGADNFRKARRGAFLDAGVARDARRQPGLAHRRREQRRQHAALGAQRELRFRQRPSVGDLGQRRAQLALNHGQLDHLRDEDCPGHQRGKGEPDHDRLDQHVGRLEHRPWRQFAEFGGGGFEQFAFAIARRGCCVCGRCGLGRLRRLGGRGWGLRNRGRLLNRGRGWCYGIHALLGR